MTGGWRVQAACRDSDEHRADTRSILTRADQRWSVLNSDEMIDPPRMDALVTALEQGLVNDLETELANVKALLARVVGVINDGWDPECAPASQVTEALRQLRAVRAYLLSQNQHKEVA